MYSKHLLATALVVATTVGCAHATPVTSAPLSADEGARLQAALIGTCEVTETEKEGGPRKEAAGLTWTFDAKGRGSFGVPGGMNFGNTFNYKLDGRNLLMDGTYKSVRVDDYSGRVLKLFFYEISETYYCTKR